MSEFTNDERNCDRAEKCRRCDGTGYIWIKGIGPMGALCSCCLGGGVVNRGAQPDVSGKDP